jgi:hypothetical protein
MKFSGAPHFLKGSLGRDELIATVSKHIRVEELLSKSVATISFIFKFVPLISRTNLQCSVLYLAIYKYKVSFFIGMTAKSPFREEG